jgi:4-hydroxybenzoate polyprenyltransferase
VNGLLEPVRTWGRMVKFSHSVFALPFALSGAALAALESGGIGWERLFWIVVAMVTARNAAMSFNRLADQPFDAENPRTARRELPAGRLGRQSVWAITGLLCALFLFAAWQLGPLCGLLAPLALLVVIGYSYTKRFTWLSHLVLGLALAMAPVGGWLAVSGRFSAVAWMLGGAVLMWVAGFDVVYACQDAEFDRRAGLYSIPARFGVGASLWVARLLHLGALLGLAGVGRLARLHPVYWIGWALIGLLLIWEHRLVRADDLSRLGVAFFNMNGLISVIYLATILAATLLPGS